MTDVQVRVEGLDELIAKFNGIPQALLQHATRAGKLSSDVILNVEGTRRYPPPGSGNSPPTPYYVRGVGTQYANYNAGNSEQYGQRFTVEQQGLRTTIGNTASYAPYLADEFRQARVMASIGWRKLIDAAKQSLSQIGEIYSKEVDAALKQLRLK